MVHQDARVIARPVTGKFVQTKRSSKLHQPGFVHLPMTIVAAELPSRLWHTSVRMATMPLLGRRDWLRYVPVSPLPCGGKSATSRCLCQTRAEYRDTEQVAVPFSPLGLGNCGGRGPCFLRAPRQYFVRGKVDNEERRLTRAITRSATVSVIMPTFNRSALLPKAIESVRRQDYEAWELIVVDDGSSDDTQAVLARFAGDSRIRCFRQENRGQASARNYGIREAHGAWIAFIDSDDQWLAHKLRKQMEYLAGNPDMDIVYGEVERIDLVGRVLPRRRSMQRHSGWVWRALLDNNFIGMSTAVVRADKLRKVGGFDETMRVVEDYDLWLRLSATGRFGFLPGVVSQYRVAGPRVSDHVRDCAEANVAAVERFLTTHPALLPSAEVARVRSQLHGRIARDFAHEGMLSRSLAAALTAVWFAPGECSAWRTLAAVALHPVRSTLRGGEASAR